MLLRQFKATIHSASQPGVNHVPHCYYDANRKTKIYPTKHPHSQLCARRKGDNSPSRKWYKARQASDDISGFGEAREAVIKLCN